jgi:hypothetical protein
VSIVGMKLSHRNLDPLGRKKGEGRSTLLGDKGFPSLPAVVENHCPLLFIVVSHISAAMCGVVVDVEGELFCCCRADGEDHPVSRGQGEPLRGQRLRAANQGASCEALQLEQFPPSEVEVIWR